MSAFSDHLRLTILRALAHAPQYTANSSIIHTVCGEVGLSATRDQVKTEIAWLAEQGLLTRKLLAEDMGGLIVATLSERGLDVADGRAVQPGVQRPAPGA